MFEQWWASFDFDDGLLVELSRVFGGLCCTGICHPLAYGICNSGHQIMAF